MDNIQQMNDIAVCAMNFLDYGMSKQLLTAAIKSMQQRLQETSAPMGLVQLILENQTTPTPCVTLSLRSVVSQLHSGGQTVGQQNDEQTFPLYSRAFVFDIRELDPEASILTTTSEQDIPKKPLLTQLALCCAICLYNLALVNQMEAYGAFGNRSMTPSQVDSVLQSALSMYESAQSILRRFCSLEDVTSAICVTNNNTHDESFSLLYMAICTNMASVFYHFGNLPEVQFCKNDLSQTLEQSCRDHLHKLQTEQQSLQFFRVVTICLTDFVHARAA